MMVCPIMFRPIIVNCCKVEGEKVADICSVYQAKVNTPTNSMEELPNQDKDGFFLFLDATVAYCSRPLV